MDRFEALNLFMAVADLKSFSRAAEQFYLPRSTVSTTIKRLEQRMMVPLLHRTTRRVELTPEGHAFYRQSQEVLAALARTESMFHNDVLQVKGRIRVDMTSTTAQNTIIPGLPAFLQAYPEIRVEIGSADRHLDLIHEGIDCAIRVGWGQESGLNSQKICDMPLVNGVSPAYVKRYGMPQALEDLKHHYLIDYVQHFGAAPEGFEYFDGKKYKICKMQSLVTVNTVQGYKSACLAGLGICQMPVIAVQEELNNGTLLAILADYQAQAMPLRWVYPYTQQIPCRVRVFMEWFQPVLEKHLQITTAD
jgi:DNA-binding transcriptional LysR family regulator